MKEKELYQVFSAMAPNEKQKEIMLEKILQTENISAEGTASTRRRTGKHSRILAAALVLTILVTTTVFASQLGLDTLLVNYLGPRTEEQITAITSGAQIIDKKAIQKNGTLHIKQVVGDHNNLYIFMQFIAPEDVSLDAARYRFESAGGTASVSGYSGYNGVGFDMLRNGSHEDNSIDMVMTVSSATPLNGKKITLSFDELCGAGPLPSYSEPEGSEAWEAAVFTPVLSGNWKISFGLDYEDCSTLYPLAEKVDLYGYEAEIRSVTVSPFAVSMDLESPYLREISKAGQEQKDRPEVYAYPVVVYFTDGTSSLDLPVIEEYEEDLPYVAEHHSDFLSGKMEIRCDFRTTVFDKEVEAIEFFDQLIHLR